MAPRISESCRAHRAPLPIIAEVALEKRLVADAIARHVLDTSTPHFGLTRFFADVAPLRPEKC